MKIFAIEGGALNHRGGIGFVTFCTKDYIPILSNLIHSIHVFSKFPLHIFCINFSLNISPLIRERVTHETITLVPQNFYTICAAKLWSAIHSPFEVTLMLDADMIVTPEIDRFFSIESNRLTALDHPLFSRHPHDNLRNHPRSDTIKRLFESLSIELKEYRYVFASFFFSKGQISIFKEALGLMQANHMFGEDEVVLNALIHKYDLRADIGYCWLPGGSEEILQYYLAGDTKRAAESYTKYDCDVKFFVFHGHKIKDPRYTRDIVKKLVDLQDSLPNIARQDIS